VDEGLVEIYDHQGEGHERSVKAIRLTNSNLFKNNALQGLGDILKGANSEETVLGARQK